MKLLPIRPRHLCRRIVRRYRQTEGRCGERTFLAIRSVWPRYYDPAQEFADFGSIGAVAIRAGVVVFAIAPWMSRLMESVH